MVMMINMRLMIIIPVQISRNIILLKGFLCEDYDVDDDNYNCKCRG